MVIRIVEYFMIKTDSTFLAENFIHKLLGIGILVCVLKIMKYQFKDIGFEKNKFLRYVIDGLLFRRNLFWNFLLDRI